jgi:hypothetical protein
LALEIFAVKDATEFAVPMPGSTHEGVYRGKVIPTNKEVLVELEISKIDAENRIAVASGFVIVDDLVIYELKNFTLGSP